MRTRTRKRRAGRGAAAAGAPVVVTITPAHQNGASGVPGSAWVVSWTGGGSSKVQLDYGDGGPDSLAISGDNGPSPRPFGYYPTTDYYPTPGSYTLTATLLDVGGRPTGTATVTVT